MYFLCVGSGKSVMSPAGKTVAKPSTIFNNPSFLGVRRESETPIDGSCKLYND